MKRFIVPPIIWVGVCFALIIRVFQKDWISTIFIFIPFLMMMYVEIVGRKKKVVLNTVFHKITFWDSLFLVGFIGLELVLFLETKVLFDFIKYCACSLLLYVPLARTIHKTA